METIVSTQRQIRKCSVLSRYVASNSTNTSRNKISWLSLPGYFVCFTFHPWEITLCFVFRPRLFARYRARDLWKWLFCIHNVKYSLPLAVPLSILYAQSFHTNKTSSQYVFYWAQRREVGTTFKTQIQQSSIPFSWFVTTETFIGVSFIHSM